MVISKVVLGRKATGRPYVDLRPPKLGCDKPFSVDLEVKQPPEKRINHTTDRLAFDQQKDIPVKKINRLRPSPFYGTVLHRDLPLKRPNPHYNVQPIKPETRETLILA